MKLLLLAPFVLLSGFAPQETTELSSESFDGLLAQIQPTQEEQGWEGIPWRPSLALAVMEARAADKPILLWAMNGHPLGCV